MSYSPPPPPPPPPPGGGYGQSAGAAPKTNTLAIVALIVSLCVCAPAGAVCGYIARNQIRDSGGTQTGDGLALAAMIIGAIGTILGILWFVFVVLLAASDDTDTLRMLLAA